MLTRRTSQAAVPVLAQEIASTEQSPETNSDPIGTISTSGEVARRLHPRQFRSPDQPPRAPDVGTERRRRRIADVLRTASMRRRSRRMCWGESRQSRSDRVLGVVSGWASEFDDVDVVALGECPKPFDDVRRGGCRVGERDGGLAFGAIQSVVREPWVEFGD